MEPPNDINLDFEQEQTKETIADIRIELILLAEEEKIPYTVNYIKKAGKKNLEEIRTKYKLKQKDSVNAIMTKHLVNKMVDMMAKFGLILQEDSLLLKEELLSEPAIMDELKDVVGTVSADVPSIGLICAAVIISKYLFKIKDDEKNTEDED